MEAPDDVNVEMTHFDEAMGALPEFVVSWTETRKAKFIQQIADETANPAGTQSLDLATSVFVCAQPLCSDRGLFSFVSYKPALIGWESIAAHRCRNTQRYYFHQNICNTSVETTVQFSQRGHVAAASLATFAGLQVGHATAAEMDKLDLRFLCLACSPRIYKEEQSFNAFSWRAAVRGATIQVYLSTQISDRYLTSWRCPMELHDGAS